MTRRQRSRRSYVIEIAITALAIVAIWLWLVNGGLSAFGEWFAERMGTP